MKFDVSAFREGDKLQLELLYDIYYKRLRVNANKQILDLAMSEDIAIDAILSLWNNRHKINGENHIEAKLYRSVRNACLNYQKRRKMLRNAHKEINYLGASTVNDPYYMSIHKEDIHSYILKEIDALPPGVARVFRLTYIDNLNATAIARQLHISRKTVLNQQRKAIKLLRAKRDLLE